MPGVSNTKMTISTVRDCPLLGLQVGTGSSADGGTRAFRSDCAAGEMWAEYTFSSRNKISTGFAFYMTNGYVGDHYVSCDLFTALRGGGDTCVFNFYDAPYADGAAGFSMETGGGSTSVFKLENDTWYWVTMLYDGPGTTSYLRVYQIIGDDPTYWPIVADQTRANFGNSGTYFRFGRYDNHGGTGDAIVFYDDLAFDLDGSTWPLLPNANPIIPSDRRVQWTEYVGIPGGIPTNYGVFVTNICVNIPGTNRVAVGDGVTDDYTAFATAIALATNRSIITMPDNKNFLLNTRLTVGSTTKAIILRGQGTNTQISGNLYFGAAGSLDTQTNVVGYPVKGTNRIYVQGTNHFKVGDFAQIVGGDDTNFVNLVGYEDSASSGQWQTVQITAVGQSNFTFIPPLAWNLTNGAQATVRIYNYSASNTNFTQGIGLESFKLNPSTGIDTTAIQAGAIAYCWITNVEVASPANWCINTHRAFRCHFTGNFLHDATVNGSGGGYGFTLDYGSTANLIDNNIAKDMTGAFQVNEGSCWNVFAYNYVPESDYYDGRWTQPDFQNHLAHPMMNLWEGNCGFMALFDDIHGSSSHHTLFRNRLFGYQAATNQYQVFCVGVETWNTYVNAVGNVLGTTNMTTYQMTNANWDFSTKAIWALGYDALDRSNTLAETTLLRHGNFDTVTSTNYGLVWGTNTDHTLPDSLYFTNRPAYFTTGYPWPPYDPALTNTVSATNLPAAVRYTQSGAAGGGSSGNRSATVSGTFRAY